VPSGADNWLTSLIAIRCTTVIRVLISTCSKLFPEAHQRDRPTYLRDAVLFGALVRTAGPSESAGSSKIDGSGSEVSSMQSPHAGEINERPRQSALTDLLTGLPNARALRYRFSEWKKLIALVVIATASR